MISPTLRNNLQKKSFLESIVSRKLEKPFVIVSLILGSLFIAYVVAKGGSDVGFIILSAIAGLPVAYASAAYPKFGIIALIVISFFINYVSRFLPEPTPIGLVMDLLTYLLILGFFIRQKAEKNWSYFHNPITWFVLIWIGYNLFEVINPNAASILAWVFTVRTVGFIMLMYFIFLFHIRTRDFIKLLIKVWLGLALISALVGFQQEFIGFLPDEYEWLHRYPERFSLLFIGGHVRKFSIFSDPVVFAYNMVAAALLCVALMFGNLKISKKVILGILAFIFIVATLFTGTRASYVIIPAGLLMLFILNFNKKVFVAAIFIGLIFGFLIVVPTSNGTLARFQSAFRPSKDASFNERAKNQERIKPYILSHPIGGGLGSVGIWGQRFSPNSYLAKFPPDSGYVRVAVEMGWIGLLLFCIFNFVIMYKGIHYFYIIKDPELKSYCLAMLIIIFSFDVGNYPQQALVQYPSNILFFLAVAIINVTMRLDRDQRKLQQQPARLEVASK